MSMWCRLSGCQHFCKSAGPSDWREEYSLRGWAVQGANGGRKLYTLDFLGLVLSGLGNQGGG